MKRGDNYSGARHLFASKTAKTGEGVGSGGVSMSGGSHRQTKISVDAEEVTYLKHSAGVYTVFAKDGGHLLGDVEHDGLYWWAGSHRYPTRREAAEMLLDRHLAHATPRLDAKRGPS